VTENTKEIEGSTTTKNPRKKRTIPKDSTQEMERVEEINGGMHNNTNIPMQEEIGGGNFPDLDMLVQTAQTETLSRKRTVLQTTGQCKKMKAHKDIPQLTLT
jgi:hypothetical protein